MQGQRGPLCMHVCYVLSMDADDDMSYVVHVVVTCAFVTIVVVFSSFLRCFDEYVCTNGCG